MTTDKALLNISTCPLDDLSNIEKRWLNLEAKCQGAFFLSWQWIGTWLRVYRPEGQLIQVKRGDSSSDTVALAIVIKSTLSQRLKASTKRLLLHQTGDWLKDQIWIEYNGLLCVEEHKLAATQAFLSYLQKEVSDWDELNLSGITKDEKDNFVEAISSQEQGARVRIADQQLYWSTASYGVDLDKVRSLNKSYLESLSKNTRYQIRRSFKRYDEQGGLALIQAKSQQEALDGLNKVAPLHIERWGSELGQSGFVNEHFVEFHEALVSSAWDNGNIDVLRFEHNGRLIAYFYNFLYRNRVYFYLSGIVQETDSKLKPGLCAHSLAIDHYLERGFHFYDFMGGDDRYKSNIGEKHAELFQIGFRKARINFKIESALRWLKENLSKN